MYHRRRAAQELPEKFGGSFLVFRRPTCYAGRSKQTLIEPESFSFDEFDIKKWVLLGEGIAELIATHHLKSMLTREG